MDEPTPAVAVPDAAAPPIAEESGSLADHEARYRDGGRPEPEPEPTRQAQTEPETPPADQPDADAAKDDAEPDDYGPRDEKGKFLPRKRHRAQSQEATPADVPRIRELTARLRAAEAERDALRASSASRLAPSSLPAAPSAPEPAPKPTPDRFTSYDEYVEALTEWKTDQKLLAAEQKRQQAEQQRHAESERQRLTQSWETKKAAARQRYPDFDAIALDVDTPIPPGSLIDAWILEHDAGADVLYHLQRHPDEVHALLQQPVLKQAESLSLLSQRFHPNGRPPAAATGSAAASAQPPPPKPPNPVRTGPVRAGDDPPDPDKSSLADHEKWWAPRSRRGGGSARA